MTICRLFFKLWTIPLMLLFILQPFPSPCSSAVPSLQISSSVLTFFTYYQGSHKTILITSLISSCYLTSVCSGNCSQFLKNKNLDKVKLLILRPFLSFTALQTPWLSLTSFCASRFFPPQDLCMCCFTQLHLLPFAYLANSYFLGPQ